MEKLGAIIDSLIDDFLTSSSSRTLNIEKILALYQKAEIIEYYNSCNFFHYKTELQELLVGDDYTTEAYKNFNYADKKNYIKLLSMIVSAVTSRYNDLIPHQQTLVFGNTKLLSIPPTDIAGATCVVLYESNTKKLLVLIGDMVINRDGTITGVRDSFKKRIISPQFIISGLMDGTLELKDLGEFKLNSGEFKINKNTFICHIIISPV